MDIYILILGKSIIEKLHYNLQLWYDIWEKFMVLDVMQ